MVSELELSINPSEDFEDDEIEAQIGIRILIDDYDETIYTDPFMVSEIETLAFLEPSESSEFERDIRMFDRYEDNIAYGNTRTVQFESPDISEEVELSDPYAFAVGDEFIYSLSTYSSGTTRVHMSDPIEGKEVNDILIDWDGSGNDIYYHNNRVVVVGSTGMRDGTGIGVVDVSSGEDTSYDDILWSYSRSRSTDDAEIINGIHSSGLSVITAHTRNDNDVVEYDMDTGNTTTIANLGQFDGFSSRANSISGDFFDDETGILYTVHDSEFDDDQFMLASVDVPNKNVINVEKFEGYEIPRGRGVSPIIKRGNILYVLADNKFLGITEDSFDIVEKIEKSYDDMYLNGDTVELADGENTLKLI